MMACHLVGSQMLIYGWENSKVREVLHFDAETGELSEPQIIYPELDIVPAKWSSLCKVGPAALGCVVQQNNEAKQEYLVQLELVDSKLRMTAELLEPLVEPAE